MSCATEKFIREAAAKGWSRTMTREHMGLSRPKFQLLLDAMAPVDWPRQGCSVGNQLANQANRDHPAIKAARARGLATIRARYARQVGPYYGTMPQLAAQAGMSRAKVQRLMARGKTLAQALGVEPGVATA